MANINFEFNGTEQDLNKNDFDRSPLPDGKYLAQITGSDFRGNSSGTGSYVMVEFEVIDGAHNGRKVWANYNIKHTNQQAQEIGQQQFAKLCLATLGKPSCNDTDDLLNRQVVLGVGLDKKDESRNRVKWTESAQAAPVLAPAHSAAPSLAKPANPWEKPKA